MNEFAEALGHLRQAVHRLLSQPDPTARTLLLATRLLDLEELLGAKDVEPVFITETDSAARSLRVASRLLGGAPNLVPSEAWPVLEFLLAELNDRGHR